MSATQEEGVQKSKREKDYEELVAAREAERTEGPVLGTETHEEGEGAPQEPQQEVAMITIMGSDGQAYQVPADGKLRLKIDGEEVEESFDRVTRSYQKGAAADKRLETAARKQRELEQKEQELHERGQRLTQQEQAALQKLQKMQEQHEAGRLSPDAYKDKAKALVEALLEADEPVEAVAKVIPTLFPDQQQPPFDPAQLDGVIEQKINLREERAKAQAKARELTQAQTRFKEEHSDLDSDPVLRQAVNEFTKGLQQETPGASPWEIIDEAAKRTRQWQEEKFGKQPRPRAKPSPQPAAARASVGKEERPPSRLDVLNELRAARGQPPLADGPPK